MQCEKSDHRGWPNYHVLTMRYTIPHDWISHLHSTPRHIALHTFASASLNARRVSSVFCQRTPHFFLVHRRCPSIACRLFLSVLSWCVISVLCQHGFPRPLFVHRPFWLRWKSMFSVKVGRSCCCVVSFDDRSFPARRTPLLSSAFVPPSATSYHFAVLSHGGCVCRLMLVHSRDVGSLCVVPFLFL